MEYFELLFGIIALVYGGKYLVKGGVSIAVRYNIPTLVVGVTIVAPGTSAPELLVSINAAITGHPEIAVGNVIGSNISNIALVLALTAIIIPIPVKKQSLLTDWPVMMLASILFFLFILNDIFELYEGIIFVLLLTGYILFLIRKSRRNIIVPEVEIKSDYSVPISLLIVILASVSLALGAHFLVSGASEIARFIGVSERVISITIVAFGTSVPELATSIIAAMRKEMDISIGNIIGSNIFNMLAVLGITGIVIEIPVLHNAFRYDIMWMLAISVALFLFIFPFKDRHLRRWAGVILFISYLYYVFMLFHAEYSK